MTSLRPISRMILCAVLLAVLLALPFFARAADAPLLATATGNDPPTPSSTLPTPSSTIPTGSSTPPANLPINPNLPVFPGSVPISGPEGQGPAGLVANIYSFGFLVAGLLAFAMIVYGGVRYTFSAGNHSAQSDAKDSIKQALLGLALLLVAYLILRTINPDLTNLRLPTLEPYVLPAERPLGSVSCEGQVLAPVHPEALPFENGNPVSYRAPYPQVAQNLVYLEEQVRRARSLLALDSRYRNAVINVNSAYRPYWYQAHFHQVWLGDQAFRQNPALVGQCPELYAQVDAEMKKHKLGSRVAAPSCNAPHVRGTAVDISIQNITHEQLNAFFAETRDQRGPAGVYLRWQAIPGDEAHYNAINPPNPTVSNCYGA